jgi:hypothetical protein
MNNIAKAQYAQERLSIDDWIRDPSKRRTVEFQPAGSLMDALNPEKLPFRCAARQATPIHITAYGFGHTCAEAFWDAVSSFKANTGQQNHH